METLNWTDIIVHAYWPAIIVFSLYLFKTPLSAILVNRKICLTLPNGASASITSEMAEKTLTRLFTEFYVIYNNLLSSSDRSFFKKLLHSDTTITVNQLVPNFDRNNEEHIGALRALRGMGLIEPQGGGKWLGNSVIEITSFAKVFADYLELKDQQT